MSVHPFLLPGILILTSNVVRPGLRIVDTSCECRRSNDSCQRTVIENIRSDTPIPFPVRRLAVSEAQRDQWDLSVFGLPEHPLFKDTKRVQPLICDYLELEFPTVADRKQFNSHLRLAFQLRDEAQKSHKRTMDRAIFFGDRPHHTQAVQKAPDTAPVRSSN